MTIQLSEILKKFPELLKLERGSDQMAVEKLWEPSSASEKQMIFVGKAEHMTLAKEGQSKIWVVDPKLLADVPASIPTVLTSPRISLAMALVGQNFFPIKINIQIIEGSNISERATISPKATLGKNCIVNPGAVIGDDCHLGDGVIVGANTVIEPGVTIGSKTRLHPLVFIGHSCLIGERCEIKPHTTIGGEGYGYAQDQAVNHHRIPHYGRVVIENDVHIGAGVQIDRGTFKDSRIGSGTKIDNHCHFGHNIEIGRGTIITGGMITAGSVQVGSFCVIGGRTTVAGHLRIGDQVQLGGMSGVTKSVLTPGQYGGLPLQKISDELKLRASFKKLPGMQRTLAKVVKKLGLDLTEVEK
ncbi:MAG: UDP-3-O-(3-hydroxymyristoyl)glucosamine N-acyltransferase [Bdellovibrionales bacterium]